MMTGLNNIQYAALVLVGNCTGLLSLLGSLLVCHSAWSKRNKIYHRLLFALSLSDVLSSTGMILHPWLMPRGTPNLIWAVGNDNTCTLMGFWLLIFQLLVPFFSCALSLMFVCTVRYKWTDDRIYKYVELPIYVLAPIISLFVGISAVVTESIVPTIFINVCWISECSINQLYSEGSCIEEVSYVMFVAWFVVPVILINTVVAIMSTVLTYLTIRSRNISNLTFQFRGTVNESALRRERQVANQAIAYAVAYFNMIVWILVSGALLPFDVWLYKTEGSAGLYVVQLLMWTFLPSQGMMNFLVYTRPMYMKWRGAFPEKSKSWALWKASSHEPPPCLSSSRLSGLHIYGSSSRICHAQNQPNSARSIILQGPGRNDDQQDKVEQLSSTHSDA